MTRIDRHNLDPDCLYGGECIDCSAEQRALDAWLRPAADDAEVSEIKEEES